MNKNESNTFTELVNGPIPDFLQGTAARTASPWEFSELFRVDTRKFIELFRGRDDPPIVWTGWDVFWSPEKLHDALQNPILGNAYRMLRAEFEVKSAIKVMESKNGKPGKV